MTFCAEQDHRCLAAEMSVAQLFRRRAWGLRFRSGNRNATAEFHPRSSGFFNLDSQWENFKNFLALHIRSILNSLNFFGLGC